jgi:hypothetical protein
VEVFIERDIYIIKRELESHSFICLLACKNENKK